MNLPADWPLTQISAAFIAPSKRRRIVLSATSEDRSKDLRYRQMPCHWGFSLPATSASMRAVWGRATVSHLLSSKDGEEAAGSSARRNCQQRQKESAKGSAVCPAKAANARRTRAQDKLLCDGHRR